jgi:Spy/CpxP family protein refolding chaperone
MLGAAALIAALSVSGAAYAQGPDADGRGGRGSGGSRFGGPGGSGGGLPIRALNLSEAQQEQVRAIRERHAADIRTAQERLRKAMNAQRKVVETIPVNEGLIRTTTQELADAQTDVAIEQARVLTDTWAILTPAQQAQVKKLQAEREARAQQPRTRGAQQRPQR